MAPLPELLDVDQLAAELGQPRRWIYRQTEERGMPHFKVGRSLLFDRVAVAAWLQSLAAGTSAAHQENGNLAPQRQEPVIQRAPATLRTTR